MAVRTIRLKETIRQEREIEVEFPIYRAFDITPDGPYPSHIIYTRINEDLHAVSIHICGNHVELEIEEKHHFDNSEIDYHLGKGIYESSKEDFEAALRILKERVNSV